MSKIVRDSSSLRATPFGAFFFFLFLFNMCSSVLNTKEEILNKILGLVLDFEGSKSGINTCGRSIQMLWTKSKFEKSDTNNF